MPEPNEVTEVEVPVATTEPDPEDFNAWDEWRDNGGGTLASEAVETETPAAGEQTPQSEPLEETPESQIAPESETEEEAEQEEEAEAIDPEQPVAAKPKTGLSKRMRELTGEIKALKSQLAELHQQPESDEEAEAEVVSATEAGTEADEPKAPRLKDFEDDDEKGLTAWDQYEVALEAFHEAKFARALAKDRAEEAKATELKLATTTANLAWAKAAERYPDYNEIVKDRPDVRVSPAMIAVAKMDPESGTDVAYYLGTHPEESNRIADSTLANNEKEWNEARVRVGVEYGLIRAKIAAAKTTSKAEPKPAPKPPTLKPAPPPPTPKKITTASKPPTQLRGTAAIPKTDTMSDDDARDYDKWERARNAELAQSGKR